MNSPSEALSEDLLDNPRPRPRPPPQAQAGNPGVRPPRRRLRPARFFPPAFRPGLPLGLGSHTGCLENISLKAEKV